MATMMARRASWASEIGGSAGFQGACGEIALVERDRPPILRGNTQHFHSADRHGDGSFFITAA